MVRENKELLAKLLQIPEPAPLVREKIGQGMPTAEKISTSVELPLSPAAKDVLRRAHAESAALGHRHIGVEHLLLGVLGEGGSLAAAVVAEGASRSRTCGSGL